MKRILTSALIACFFLGCSGGNGKSDGAAGSGAGGAGASGGASGSGVSIACTNTANGCTEYHLSSGTSTKPISDPCTQLGGTVAESCTATPFAGCCVIKAGSNEICYYGVYAQDPKYDLSHSCSLAGGVWNPA